ncbi:unnamed protein product [Ambrosiozyma monospora]|uniref:Unnamed protein product n=1 Tax=Ambrosiozyma monospora TaxID=43982 RepID=A0ACB5UCJ4_AMBMO|nr:unnamed protein product [Ambrosiozyma monospora]
MPYSFNLDFAHIGLDTIMKQMMYVLFTINGGDDSTTAVEYDEDNEDENTTDRTTLFNSAREVILGEFTYAYPGTTADVLFRSDPNVCSI